MNASVDRTIVFGPGHQSRSNESGPCDDGVMMSLHISSHLERCLPHSSCISRQTDTRLRVMSWGT